MKDELSLFRLRRVLCTILIVASASIMVMGCDDNDTSPLLYELRHDDMTMFLFGTVHTLPTGESLDAMPDYVERAFSRADILVVESLPASDSQINEMRSIMRGSEERPSVRQMVDEWDPTRRRDFLEAFKEFPGHSSSEAAAALELRPFAAQMHVSSLLDRLANIRPTLSASVEAWLFEQAERRNLEIVALEDPVDVWKAFDAVSQHQYLLELEDMVLLRPDTERLTRAWRDIQKQVLESWAAGRYLPDSEHLLARELGAPADSLAFQENTQHLFVMYDFREETWLEALRNMASSPQERNHTLFVGVGSAHLDPELGAFVMDLQEAGWQLLRQWP